MIISIHQPNFLPWLGFFHKMAHSDVMILLDDVPFPQTSTGTNINRVRIKGKQEAFWLTLPIQRKMISKDSLIKDIHLLSPENSLPKALKTLELTYLKAAHFSEIKSLLTDGFNARKMLSPFNLSLIEAIKNLLNIPTQLYTASTLHTTGVSNEKLIQLVQKLGGTTYLCGNGADGYMNHALWKEAQIDVVYQQFSHPSYKQFTASFTQGLSIVDSLAHLGRNEVKNIIFS